MRPNPAYRAAYLWLPPRDTIRETAIERGESLAAMSRLLGKHSSYLQRYVEHGVPARLTATDRDRLERYLALPAGELCEDAEEYRAIRDAAAKRDTRPAPRRPGCGASRRSGARAGAAAPQPRQ
ncbi:hypothetical protein [Sphingomonas sp. CCH9-E2]|uniref:hypothetical protein n=1 Tax=Sphingomonas sp. CCH9-E2 TaxID=1768776 RepID=UPI00083605AC|nr:hypothetical protein [Sphingomonas sp. CCH9-E2]